MAGNVPKICRKKCALKHGTMLLMQNKTTSSLLLLFTGLKMTVCLFGGIGLCCGITPHSCEVIFLFKTF